MSSDALFSPFSSLFAPGGAKWFVPETDAKIAKIVLQLPNKYDSFLIFCNSQIIPIYSYFVLQIQIKSGPMKEI